MGDVRDLIREIFQYLKNLITSFAVLNHFHKKGFQGLVLLIIVFFLTNCNGRHEKTIRLHHFDDLEILTASPYFSKYSYIFLCPRNECDTIQIYKAESNQILLFHRTNSMDTLFICDRWDNANIFSHHIPIIKVDFNDTNFFFTPGGSIHRLRSEYRQICIPEVKDIQSCNP